MGGEGLSCVGIIGGGVWSDLSGVSVWAVLDFWKVVSGRASWVSRKFFKNLGDDSQVSGPVSVIRFGLSPRWDFRSVVHDSNIPCRTCSRCNASRHLKQPTHVGCLELQAPQMTLIDKLLAHGANNALIFSTQFRHQVIRKCCRC